MQDVLEVFMSKRKKNRFVWQVVRIAKNSRKIIMQSGKDVDWANKYSAKRGFIAHRRALTMIKV